LNSLLIDLKIANFDIRITVLYNAFLLLLMQELMVV